MANIYMPASTHTYMNICAHSNKSMHQLEAHLAAGQKLRGLYYSMCLSLP